MSIDLHVHSTYSDGTLRPAELVELALGKGLTALSITDHDTTEGTAEALEAAGRTSLEVVPGIELSVVDNDRHLHLLGYYIDPDNSEMKTALADIQAARRTRNGRIIEKLRALRLDVSMAEVEAKSAVGQTGRPHIAQVLVDRKIARSMEDAFARFLKRGAVAYVPRLVLDAGRAIMLIREAGGIAVLAHPGTIDSSLRTIPEIVEQLAAAGLGGIEAYYPVHSARNQKQLSALASRYGLVVTGGSDYHGDIRPGTMIAGGRNMKVPVEILQRLKDKLAR